MYRSFVMEADDGAQGLQLVRRVGGVCVPGVGEVYWIQLRGSVVSVGVGPEAARGEIMSHDTARLGLKFTCVSLSSWDTKIVYSDVHVRSNEVSPRMPPYSKILPQGRG